MNRTVLAIIVCAAAILIGVGAYFAMSAQNNGGADHGDLSILDSDENIVKGLTMTYDISDSDGKGNAKAKTVVKEVVDNDVKYTSTYKGVWKDDTSIELDNFSKSEFMFDYTDSSAIPEGVTVNKEGDSYRINGVYTEEYDTDYTKYTFKDLVITTDGTETVKSVTGQIADEYTYTLDEENYEKYTDVYSYKTKDSKLYADWEFEGAENYVVTKDKFFEASVIYTYSPDLYKGATITESSGKLGDFKVKIYTVNGDVHDGSLIEKYEDYKVYVYGKYIISTSGKVDGDKWQIDVMIKIEK